MPRDDERNGLEQTCRQCPTQSLRSQCPHTLEGREYLKEQNYLRQRAQESSLPPAYHWLLPHSSGAARNWAVTGPSPDTSLPTGHANTSNLSAALVQSTDSGYQIDLSLLPAGSVNIPTRSVQSTANSPAVTGSGGANSVSSSNQLPLSNPSRSFGPPESDSDNEAARRTSTSRRPRLRISKQNPAYGHVDGAMRGNQMYKILRTKPLRPVIEEQAEASARFLRSVSDIIDRCERVSHETGCWLHFSAQHLFARGGFLHYTSPRFLREAKQDAEQIINHSHRAFSSLIAARNKESKDMHKRLLAAEENKAASDAALAIAQEAERNALGRAESIQRERDSQAEEMEVQRLQLEALRAQLALAQKKVGTPSSHT
ncbi:hypothetical protein MSAN_01272200 [Mycena sanguinolenta]|uniref:Uncharacterized protein n=1 Tax=Mycena sanguinolenta TaxID=230812 RepID=A0A8H6YDU9_9AGAR|nr:hypothetical protein MSAN_02529600 [Mycena sanguinolenta]KAF7359298.1 hypothetical protein MSAN_01272200 [Mycena sanguinolenta]